MNTLNVMTLARNRWFHLGVVALVSILLIWAIVLHPVTSIQIHVPEVSRATPSALSAARQRFENFKQAQVEGMGGARVSAPSAGRLRFEDFKRRQIEQ
jgi:hypothetical protein